MRNVELSVQGRTLVARIDLDADKWQSKSGKSMNIGSTEGNVKVDDGKGNVIVVGINCYLGH